MPVLVAPVRVVLLVVGEPVHLIGRRSLRSALGGVAPSGEGDRVVVAEKLLHTEEVRERVIEGALYVAALGPAVGDVGRDRPTMLVESRVVRVHTSQVVVAVGSCQRYAVPGCHVAGAEVVVVASTHLCHAIVACLKRQREVHVAGLLVESANHGVSELSRFHIVYRGAVDIDVIVLLVESTVAESHRREKVPHLARIEVGAGVEDGDVLRHVIVFAQLCFRKSECRLVYRIGVLLFSTLRVLRKRHRSVAKGKHS